MPKTKEIRVKVTHQLLFELLAAREALHQSRRTGKPTGAQLDSLCLQLHEAVKSLHAPDGAQS